MIPRLQPWLALAVLLGLVACASPGNKPAVTRVETLSQRDGQQMIMDGVHCEVKVSGATWQVTTPYLLSHSSMDHTDGQVHIICNHPGYRSSEVVLRPADSNNASISIGFGGRHMGVGLSFPFRTNSNPTAAYRYPELVTIELQPE